MTHEFYTNLYERLYAECGYHSDLDYDEHSAQATRFVIDVYGEKAGNVTVLDVGCSNGKAVERLTTMGFIASGIDVSPTAIAMCAKRGLTTCSLGSATDIPYGDSTFEVITSTDVLEHLRPEDIPKMVSEFSRVARDALVVKIALVSEYHKFSTDTLHLSVIPALEWLKLFHPKFKLVEVIENCPDFFTAYLRRRDTDEPWDTVFRDYRAALHDKEAINLQGRIKRSRRALTKEKERVAEMKSEIEISKMEVARLAVVTSDLKSDLKKAKESLVHHRKRGARMKVALEKADAAHRILKNSRAYKTGRFILFPFRWISKAARAFGISRC